jgi:Rrf2 family protein
MKISTRTEYGIRVLVTLARVRDADGCLSLTEIARREKLPHAYLEQLVRDLRTAGLVTATRGQAGGGRDRHDRGRPCARGADPRDAVRRSGRPGAL